jgi:hypothetical protein
MISTAWRIPLNDSWQLRGRYDPALSTSKHYAGVVQRTPHNWAHCCLHAAGRTSWSKLAQSLCLGACHPQTGRGS